MLMHWVYFSLITSAYALWLSNMLTQRPHACGPNMLMLIQDLELINNQAKPLGWDWYHVAGLKVMLYRSLLVMAKWLWEGGPVDIRPTQNGVSLVFSRVLRDSTWRYVGMSVCEQFAFLFFFGFTAPAPHHATKTAVYTTLLSFHVEFPRKSGKRLSNASSN